jgi:sugar phosphate isomerase/epimerase
MSGVRIPAAPVALSTASVYPESTTAAFALAARLGYDGVEVMVSPDPVSQDVDALVRLSKHYGVPVLAIHSPCLLISQRVWGTDPWEKLRRSAQAAATLGARTVVVHPPFRWQRDYARTFAADLAAMRDDGVRYAVENMFPLRARGRTFSGYAPGWNPFADDHAHFTLDLSHTATAGDDPLALADQAGDRLTHVHLADGFGGTNRDEHLIPGRGAQPCADLLGKLAARDFAGTVVVEVNTRRVDTVTREADLAEALAFARLYLAAPDAASERTS